MKQRKIVSNIVSNPNNVKTVSRQALSVSDIVKKRETTAGTKREFLIRTTDKKVCFCSKCGKKILPDIYNIHKHAELCGFSRRDLEEPILDGETWGYSLIPATTSQVSDGRADTKKTDPAKMEEELAIYLEISIARILMVPGRQDHFWKIAWDTKALFRYSIHSQKPETLKNDTEYDLQKWLTSIRDGEVVRIIQEGDAVQLHKVFPSVLGVYSLQMFDFIYQHRGFRYRPVSSEIVQKIRQQSVNIKDEFCTVALQGKPTEKAKQIPARGGNINSAGNENRIPVESVDRIPACVRTCELGGEKLLVVLLHAENGDRIFILGKDYVYVNRFVNMNQLMTAKLLLSDKSLRAIMNFDRWYPEYHLNAFFENAVTDASHCRNVLIPLLSGEYHVLQELCAKAGLAFLAEELGLAAFSMDPATYSNIAGVFGIPVRIMKKMHLINNLKESLVLLEKIWKAVPYYLETERITDNVLRFLDEVCLLKEWAENNEPAGYRRTAADGLSKAKIRKVVQYLSGNPELDYQLYRDYMIMCRDYGEYIAGLTPENLDEAHDQIMMSQRMKISKDRQARFCDSVERHVYQHLTTVYDEYTREFYEDEHYLISAPANLFDLFDEGKSMHNCVFSYADAVISGDTAILFLRRKTNPEKSFGTIEVELYDRFGRRRNVSSWIKGFVRQAKAFANRKLPEDAQMFVEKWAADNGLCIDTTDLPAGRWLSRRRAG